MSDDLVQQVIDELDPTPAHEAAWPVSRRQTLRALAAVGLLGAGSSSASAESAGTVIADEAVFSNYGSESVSDGWQLTIDDDVFALTESDTETIGLPDGGFGEELVTPSGVEASEFVAPDGTVVFEDAAIPDSGGTHQWNHDEGSGTTLKDRIESLDGSISGASWVSGEGSEDVYLEYDGTDDETDLGSASRSAFTHFTEDGQGTWAVWCKPDSDSGLQSLFGANNSASTVGGHLALNDTDFRFSMTDGSGTRMWELNAGSFTTGEWNFIAGVANGSDAIIYQADKSSDFDISEQGSDSIGGGTASDWSHDVKIGNQTEDGNWYFDGGLDLMFSDSTGRTQSELQGWVDDTRQFYE